MTRLLKAGALWLAITIVVWLITIWRWQTSAHDASTGEIVLQLFLLPLGLTVFLLGVLWAVARLRQKAAAPVVAPSAAPVAGSAATVSPKPQEGAHATDEAARQLTGWVLAESATLPAGHDAATAWSGLQSRAVRPALDSELQDLNGLPIFTARVPDLDVQDWLQAHAELAQADPLPDEVLRGLSLLEGPLHQMLLAVSSLVPDVPQSRAGVRPIDSPQAHDMKAHLAGVAAPVSPAQQRAQAALAPQLTVRVLWPAQWAPHVRDQATDWLRSQCGALLDWAQAVQARGVRWLTEPVAHPEALWDEIDQQMLQWSRDGRPELWLLLAVDSAVNEDRVARMQAVGELFTSSHQTGKVPGEAAAGLLLASPHWPRVETLEAVPLRMWRPVRGRRDKSADAAGRVGATVLEAALQAAIALNQADADRLLVVSDGDHRASRTAELFEALQEVLPGVDPMLAVTRVGESCGELGMARALVPSVLACAALRQAERPDQVAVATHVQSSHERVVVALAPWQAQAA